MTKKRQHKKISISNTCESVVGLRVTQMIGGGVVHVLWRSEQEVRL